MQRGFILLMLITLLPVHAVDFAKDIQPLLKNKCSRCHSGDKRKGGFSVDSREGFLKGGETGPVVVVDKGAQRVY